MTCCPEKAFLVFRNRLKKEKMCQNIDGTRLEQYLLWPVQNPPSFLCDSDCFEYCEVSSLILVSVVALSLNDVIGCRYLYAIDKIFLTMNLRLLRCKI